MMNMLTNFYIFIERLLQQIIELDFFYSFYHLFIKNPINLYKTFLSIKMIVVILNASSGLETAYIYDCRL